MVAVGGATFGTEKVLTLKQTMEFKYADPFVKMVTKTTSPVYFLIKYW